MSDLVPTKMVVMLSGTLDQVDRILTRLTLVSRLKQRMATSTSWRLLVSGTEEDSDMRNLVLRLAAK